jgi:cyclic pyranopterin monophosphate synthase
MVYDFDEVDERLSLLPMAARRALDWAGLKLSLVAWQSLPLDARAALVAAGASDIVDDERVEQLVMGAAPAAEPCERKLDPPLAQVPEPVLAAFGATRPISDGAWRALTPLDRFALAKVAERARAPRLAAAYAEIIGESKDSPHLAARGGVRMVDVGGKEPSKRSATAKTFVRMNAEAFERLSSNNPKGDVFGTARVAAIMAAKKTSDWIPLCHPLQLTKVEVTLEPVSTESGVAIETTVTTVGRTGVEMEALTAASAAALTVYDMLKAFDKGMSIGPTVLLEKRGGKSGDYQRT